MNLTKTYVIFNYGLILAQYNCTSTLISHRLKMAT